MKALKFCLTSDFRDIVGYSLVFVFFYYLVSFACVAPSPALIGAVAFEICVYFCFLAYRIKRRKAKSVHARQVIAATIIRGLPGGSLLVTAASALVAVLGSFILACALTDAASFGLAMAGQHKAASFMYCRFPVSTLAGFNPGYTMELLSGAKLKGGKYEDVERLYKSLFDIRMVYFGARSEQICNMYADFGDLAERKSAFQIARKYYIQAINLSKEIKVAQGCGKFLTRLGEMEIEHGMVPEALKHLSEAVAMRSEIFGENSQRVADTLFVLSKLHSSIGDNRTAEKLTKRALAIRCSNSAQSVNLAFYSALITTLFMGAIYFSTSKRGWLTRFALKRLQHMVNLKSDLHATNESLLNQLDVLTEYVGEKDLNSIHANKKRKVTDNLNAAGFLLSLSSQN